MNEEVCSKCGLLKRNHKSSDKCPSIGIEIQTKKYKVYRFIGDFVTSNYDIADARQKASAKHGDCIIEYVEENHNADKDT